MQTPPASFLAVDIGNSSIDLAAFAQHFDSSAGLPTPLWRQKLPTQQTTPQELSTVLSVVLQRAGDVAWYVASVNQKSLSVLLDWSRTLASRLDLILLAPDDFPVPLDIRQGEKLGLDRRAAALAANRIRAPHAPLMIIDMGTAITINLIDAAGRFQGGAILPGIRLAARALAEGTDRLPQLDCPISPPVSPIGRDTVEAMRVGIFWGAVGSIHEVVARMSQLVHGSAEVLLTGGAADTVADHLRFPVHRQPDLVLAGIALAAQLREVANASQPRK